MKNPILRSLLAGAALATAALSPRIAAAQETGPVDPDADTPDALIGRSTLGTTGVWAGLTFASTSVSGKLAQAPGLRAGVIFGRRFGIGLTFDVLAGNEFEAKDDQIRDLGV